MKEAEVFIHEKLNILYDSIPNIKIRYEYMESLRSYFIEILPVELFKSNIDYIELEMEIEEEFENLYDEEILFITKGSLCEINNATFTLGY